MADARIAYGLAKKHGIDTTGLSPKEVWDILKEKGIFLVKDLDADRKRVADKFKETDGIGSKGAKVNLQLFAAKIS